MNRLRMTRLIIASSLVCVLVMGRLAAWMNPADPSLDIVELTVLGVGTLLLAATYASGYVRRRTEPVFFGYLWFISAAAFVSLMQNQYDTILLVVILMMYFMVSQVISSLAHLRIYMTAILLELLVFALFSGALKQTAFALAIFLTASIVIYLSTGRRLQMISKYQETEKALREMIAEKNLYERAVRDVEAGVVIADARSPEIPLVYVNDAFTAITGYGREEVLGRNCRMLQGKDTSQEQIGEIRRALREGSRVKAELLNYRKNHEPFWNELLITPLRDESGAVTHYIGIQADVTERRQLLASERQSREMLERTLEILKEAVVVMKPLRERLEPVLMNQAAQSLFDSLDRSVYSQLEIYKDLIFGVMSASGDAVQEIKLETQEGERHYRVTTGRLDELLMFSFTDITSHKEAECRFELARETLERANQAKDEFLAIISHELRTPLNSILGILQLQEEEALTEAEFAVLRSSSAHLLSLIERILDYSALENHSLQADHSVFDLRNLMAALADKYRSEAQRKGLEFVESLEGLPEGAVVGDSRRIAQIAGALLDNAVKFTSSGRVKLTATVRPHREGGKQWLGIAVEDSGAGIPADAAEGIFQPFHQLEPGLTRPHGGLGIGLALAKKLAERLGGTVSFRSRQGEGSEFIVKLPLALGAPAPQISEREPQRPLSILLAEDHLDNRNLFTAFVKPLGCRVDLAVNGAEAVQMFADSHYDMVFMDIQMPVMDGYEATRRIRALETAEGLRPSAVIALTAHAFEEHRQSCLEAGCTDFLEKPIFREQLFDIITRYSTAKAG